MRSAKGDAADRSGLDPLASAHLLDPLASAHFAALSCGLASTWVQADECGAFRHSANTLTVDVFLVRSYCIMSD